MFTSADSKRSSTVRIDSNSFENNVQNVKKKKHLTIKSDTNEEDDTSNSHWKPSNWEKTLQNIREMCKDVIPPVDYMEFNQSVNPKESSEIIRYQVLISLILSTLTKENVKSAALERLKKHGLTVDNILKTSEAQLADLICPVKFGMRKAGYIKRATQTLKDVYNNNVPNTLEDLCQLPGMGPSLAYRFIRFAVNEFTEIRVNAHLHRVSNRLGWVKRMTETPEDTRNALESWLPKVLWCEVNHILEAFGQTKCLPVDPHCDTCMNKTTCPAMLNRLLIKENSPKDTPSVVQINSNNVEINVQDIKKRKHLTIKSDTNKEDDTSNSYWKPSNWEKTFQNIREMCKDIIPPIDYMGFNQAAHLKESPEVFRYHVLISLILSTMTKEKVKFAALERLKEHGLTVGNILETSEAQLADIICPVKFAKRKAGYVKRATHILNDTYNGIVPKTVEDLCQLPGVGPKLAYRFVRSAWNEFTRIGVNAHLHRLSNRLGWVKKTTETPEDTCNALESWLPKELWYEVNHMMEGFGETTCLSVCPRCDSCLNKTSCPSAVLNSSSIEEL